MVCIDIIFVVQDNKTLIKKRLIAILAILIIIVISSMFGYQAGKNTNNLKNDSNFQINLKKCEQEKIDKNQELSRCIADNGLVINNTTKNYDFSTLGISSPLLSSTSLLTEIHYDYKQQIIKSRELVSEFATIRVWEWPRSNPILSLPLEAGKEISNYFPIFIGYENNNSHPNYVSDLSMDWKNTDSYTNKDGIKFYYWYEYGPKTIHSVQLQTYWPYSPQGNPIFIQIIIPLPDPFLTNKDPDVFEAKDRAKQIAKDISFKKN